MIERQELYCHECGNYVQFDLDLSLNGNHILRCPCCGHEHCRVVKDGKITDERWGSHNGGMKHFWIILTILIAFTLACSWGLAQTLVSIFPQLAG